MSKKNICFFTGDITLSGGTERVGTMVANQLSAYKGKYNVYILSLSHLNKSPFFEISDNISLHYIFNKRLNYNKKYFEIISFIRRFIKQNNIDIMIDIDVILDVFSIPALAFTKTKLISWEHFNYYENLGSSLRTFSRRLASKYSDLILTITEEDKKYYQENLKLKCPIKNIYNPVDSIIKDNKYDSDSKIILSAGRLTYQKGFDILIDVAKEVLKEKEDWTWIVLGEGEDRTMLQDKIEKYGLEGKVLLPGNVSNIEEYYKKAAMFVLTSRFEGLGLVLIEAKSYHLPLVSFKCRVGPAEIIEDNHNGFLVDCFNKEEMTKGICQLIEDEELRQSFSNAATDGLEKFEIDSIIKKWELVLNEL